MIVNEQPKTLAGLTKAMHKLGFPSTISVQTDEKAVLAANKKTVNCIICAYDMPNINGLSVLRMLRKKQEHIETPFFLTDPAFTTLKVLKAGQAGVSGLLVMPCTLATLSEKITSNLEEVQSKEVIQSQKEVEKGTHLIEEGKFDEAIETLQDIVNQKNNPEYFYNIGYQKSIQGKYAEAIAAFRKATQLDRLFAKAYEEMGRSYRALGQHDKADEYMGYAAQIHLERDNDGHAEEILKEVLECGSDSLNVFNSLGVIYRKRGDHDTAMTHYKKALKVHPDEPNIYYNIGRIYLDMKDMEQAKALFQQAVDIDSSFIEAKQVIKAIDLGVI